MRALSTMLGLSAMIAVGAAGPATTAASAPLEAAAADFPANMSGYHNYPEMVGEIKQAAVDFPDIVSVFSIGKSYQGRDIWAAKVSDNVATDEDEPEVLIDALHHAREHLTTEQALATLKWLTQDYGTDPTVTRLVNTREIFIIFALNPDGMQYDLTGNPFRAWRKNRQPNAGPSVGTDLNRNYGYRFGCCGGSSGSGKNIEYRGPHAFSAPETRALRDFVQSRVINGVQQIRTHITLHTNGELILWPYGYTKKNVPTDMTGLDHKVFASLGRAMARTNGYTAEQSSDLYITDGDQIDWLYATYRIFTYTFELYPTEKPTVWQDHYPDDSKIPAQTARNRAAILMLIDRAGCPYAQLGAATARADCGPLFDDLEINRGWRRNADGTDTATSGLWQVAKPGGTTSTRGQAAGQGGLGVEGAGDRRVARQDRRLERRRRRRHHDPQPGDHAPGRRRRLRQADLLVRLRAHGGVLVGGRVPGAGRGTGRDADAWSSSGRAARPTSTGRGRRRRSRSRPTRARRSGSCSSPRTAGSRTWSRRRSTTSGSSAPEPGLIPARNRNAAPGLQAGTA